MFRKLTEKTPLGPEYAHRLMQDIFTFFCTVRYMTGSFAPTATASITAEALIDALKRERVVDGSELISLLGADRHEITLFKLEQLLVSKNAISDKRLLQLKGMQAGLPILSDDSINAREDFSVDIAKRTGAISLDLPELTVAFIEDLPTNLEYIKTALNGRPFETWLMTATQFRQLFQSLYKDEERDRRPVAGTIYDILDDAVRRRASDIHLSVGQPPQLRVDGALRPTRHQPLDIPWMETELARLAGPVRMERVEETHAEDFAYQFGDARFRCNIGHDTKGLTLAARTLPTKVPSPDDLGLPKAIREFVKLERGLVLVTGPTGSGKSTTLAALLGDIALNYDRHVITLEDPIEFTLPTNGRGLVHQRELHDNFNSFPDGLRQALRQDPDVILVGELRDLETMRTAITAAETGHLVFATLHTFDASSSVGRLVSSFGESEQDQIRAQLAYILKGIVSQTLLPRQTGKGRVAAYEIMTSTPAIANNLKKMDGHHQLRQALETNRKEGMQTMDMALADLVRRGLVRETDAEKKAQDVDDFFRRVRGQE